MAYEALKKEKKASIIEAAARVFARRGYSRTLMANIATEAGIGKGTVYEYFDSKEDLFFAVFEWFVQKTEAEAKVSISALGGAASQRALKNRVNLRDVLQLVKRLRRKVELPIALLTYCNIVYRFGIKDFIKQAKLAGVDGVIVPDLPVEEAADLIREAKKLKFATIFLLAPTSDRKRIKKVILNCSGFIYYVSLTGTTGVRKDLPKELIKKVRQIKRVTTKPVCVGFGISHAQQAKAIARVADGVIVGSAIIKVIERNVGGKELVSKVVKFVGGLRQAL